MKHHPAHPDYKNRFTLAANVCREPTTIALAAAATQAIGSISQGNAQAKSLNSQAKAAEYNATINRQNAAQTSAEYSVREDSMRRAQAMALGRERAGAAESGTGAGTGSNYSILEDDTALSELDALTLRYQGQTQRKAYEQQATLNDYDATAARSSAKSAVRAGYIGAVGSALGGAYRYSNMGTPAAANPSYASSYAGSGSLPWVQDVRAGRARPNPYL